MANDLTTAGNGVGGKLPTMPTWAKSAVSGDNFDTRWALARMTEDQRKAVSALIHVYEPLVAPMDQQKRIQRMTALGMVMSPNRPPAEATMWVRETSRLLSDIAEDVLCEAIDTLQKTMKFLPTVAEIRELADPIMERRRRDFARLDAMRRYLESGKEIGQITYREAKRNVMDHRGEKMTEEETEELNGILERLGACSRYRPDGSRYEVSKRNPQTVRHDRPQMPTRSDYIAWGVDPDVLDKIEAERKQA